MDTPQTTYGDAGRAQQPVHDDGHDHGHDHGHDQAHAHAHAHAHADVHRQNGVPTTRPPISPEHYAHIPGWGVDRNPQDRPAYPMERTPPRLERIPEPEQQPLRQTVFHSTERPGITPVFGTSVPPSGVSGSIRAVAFRYSENDLRHWLLLLFADRVNMVEGLLHDLSRGHIPNVYKEMGGPAELKHNPAGFARKAAVAGAAVGLGWWLLSSRRSRRTARLRRR